MTDKELRKAKRQHRYIKAETNIDDFMKKNPDFPLYVSITTLVFSAATMIATIWIR